MNRRDFLKWISKLIVALPFVALADLEPEPETVETWGVSPLANNLDFWLKLQALSLAETQEASMKFWHDNNALWSMSWEFEAPKEEVERLSKILEEVENSISPWQQSLETNGYFYRNILQPDSEWVEYNL